jgi:chromosome segregation ATPase
MKDKAPLIVLIIVAIGLGVGLIVVNNKAHREKQELYDALTVQSNTVTTIRTSLTEQQSVNQVLETNLATTRADYSNKLTLSDANLHTAEENLEKSKAEAKAQAEADAAELARRDKKIADLENQNQDLDKQASEMRDHISGLQTQIATTKDRLSRSEGDRDVLLKELKRLQAEKTVWENRFNDLAVLQAQVRKIKNDLAEARNLDWTRRGIYATLRERGAERLIHPVYNLPPPATPAMNVELHRPAGTPIVAPDPSDISPK